MFSVVAASAKRAFSIVVAPITVIGIAAAAMPLMWPSGAEPRLGSPP